MVGGPIGGSGNNALRQFVLVKSWSQLVGFALNPFLPLLHLIPYTFSGLGGIKEAISQMNVS